MSFLKAEWRKLAIANYIIDKKFLVDYLPVGTEFDLWKGKCYVSLVGFMFVNTRLLGMKIPFHRTFEEVNLRFYVRRFEDGEWKRGVVFVKEIVPKRALTFVANTVYKENYETLPMTHVWGEENNERTVQYRWKKNNVWNSIDLKASVEPFGIEPGSEKEFITEHYWGYAKVNSKKSNEYEVTHPKWRAYEVIEYTINVDFEAVYGKKFEVLNSTEPVSVMLAEGSEITVEGKRTIKV